MQSFLRKDGNNCNSPFEKQSAFSLKFSYKKETNEIFETSEFIDNGEKKKSIRTLKPCKILDAKNWTCGGDVTEIKIDFFDGKVYGGHTNPEYVMVDGNFSYADEISRNGKTSCPMKFVKR